QGHIGRDDLKDRRLTGRCLGRLLDGRSGARVVNIPLADAVGGIIGTEEDVAVGDRRRSVQFGLRVAGPGTQRLPVQPLAALRAGLKDAKVRAGVADVDLAVRPDGGTAVVAAATRAELELPQLLAVEVEAVEARV